MFESSIYGFEYENVSCSIGGIIYIQYVQIYQLIFIKNFVGYNKNDIHYICIFHLYSYHDTMKFMIIYFFFLNVESRLQTDVTYYIKVQISTSVFYNRIVVRNELSNLNQKTKKLVDD